VPNVYQIAKNCRNRVEMIEKYYAVHIKSRLDAAAINVMRPPKFKSKTGTKPVRNSNLNQRPRNHTVQNSVTLALSRETGDAEPLKWAEPLEAGAKAGET
jgi:hypothetical protein